MKYTGKKRTVYTVETSGVQRPWRNSQGVHCHSTNGPYGSQMRAERFFSDFKLIHTHISRTSGLNVPPMPDEGGYKNILKTKMGSGREKRRDVFNVLLAFIVQQPTLAKDVLVQQFLGVRLKNMPLTRGQFDPVHRRTNSSSTSSKNMMRQFRNMKREVEKAMK